MILCRRRVTGCEHQPKIWNRDDPPQPDDLDGLQLVVISPLVQILPDGRLAQYDQGIRKMIGPWKAKCEVSGCTIVGTVHYNKKNDLAAVQRILGSVGLPNALRNTWCVERDDDDATLRLFMRVKANLTPDTVDGLSYRIVHVGPWSQSIRCDWQPEPVEKTADDVLRSKINNPKQPAGQWLVAYLRQHGCMAMQSVIIEAGAKAGYSHEAIKQAKHRNPKITSSCAGIGASWWWHLADSDAQE